MKQAKFFCTHHEEKMKASESEALRTWSALMQRGLQAYIHCRMEAADIYLSATMKIGALRAQCEKNGIFDQSHIIKPTELLIEMYLVENRHKDILDILSEIDTVIEHQSRHTFVGIHRLLSVTRSRVQKLGIKKTGSLEPVYRTKNITELKAKKPSNASTFSYLDTYQQATGYHAGKH